MPSWQKLSKSFGQLCAPGYTKAYRLRGAGLTGHKGIRDGVYDVDIFEVASPPQIQDYKALASTSTAQVPANNGCPSRGRSSRWCVFLYLVNLCGILGFTIEMNGFFSNEKFSLDCIDISAGYGPLRFSERINNILKIQ